MNVWYAIANCKNPQDGSMDFWMWDTECDICYIPSVYDNLFPDADKCRTLAEAESRATYVLSTIFDDEVHIVRVYEDDNGDMDYAEFVKSVKYIK